MCAIPQTLQRVSVCRIPGKLILFGGPGFAANPYGSNSYANADASIVPVVQGYWQSFIRELDPDCYRANGSPERGRFVDSDWLLIQTNAMRMDKQDEEEGRRCHFWDEISDSLNQ
jgi:acetylcholinesterase